MAANIYKFRSRDTAMGGRLDVGLSDMRTTEDVFWIRGNSYVLGDGSGFRNPAIYQGRPVMLVSIHGNGEVRWMYGKDDIDRAVKLEEGQFRAGRSMDPTWDATSCLLAARHFMLSPMTFDPNKHIPVELYERYLRTRDERDLDMFLELCRIHNVRGQLIFDNMSDSWLRISGIHRHPTIWPAHLWAGWYLFVTDPETIPVAGRMLFEHISAEAYDWNSTDVKALLLVEYRNRLESEGGSAFEMLLRVMSEFLEPTARAYKVIPKYDPDRWEDHLQMLSQNLYESDSIMRNAGWPKAFIQIWRKTLTKLDPEATL